MKIMSIIQVIDMIVVGCKGCGSEVHVPYFDPGPWFCGRECREKFWLKPSTLELGGKDEGIHNEGQAAARSSTD